MTKNMFKNLACTGLISSSLLMSIIFCGLVASAKGDSNEEGDQSYTLGIIGMDSENYYMDFAEISVKNLKTGEVVFNGYIINTSVIVHYNYGHYSNGIALPLNLTAPSGKYVISGKRPMTNIVVGHKRGTLACTQTVDLQSNRSITLLFNFQPFDDSQSEGSLIIAETISVAIELVLAVILFFAFVCYLISHILRTMYDRDFLALIILYIPLIILLAVTLYLNWLYNNRDFEINNLWHSSFILLLSSMLVLFIYGLISFFIYRQYNQSLEKEGIAKVYLIISIFSTIGIAIVFILFLNSSIFISCYIPLPPGPSPKLTGDAATLLISFRKNLQDKFYKNGNIGKEVYEKIKRII